VSNKPQIPGTVIFDGEQAMKGYALNKMCYSASTKANRDAFLADEEGYMRCSTA
jgi:protocatechuate 4,5-dioxygenase alpha chain